MDQNWCRNDLSTLFEIASRFWWTWSDHLNFVGPEDDEESMDWWTKYFASVDNMIEVSSLNLKTITEAQKIVNYLESLLCDKLDLSKIQPWHVWWRGCPRSSRHKPDPSSFEKVLQVRNGLVELEWDARHLEVDVKPNDRVGVHKVSVYQKVQESRFCIKVQLVGSVFRKSWHNWRNASMKSIRIGLLSFVCWFWKGFSLSKLCEVNFLT